MIEGTLILESLQEGSELKGYPIRVRSMRREKADLSLEQIAAGLPSLWSVIDFEMEDERAFELAEALSRFLEPTGWYASFQSTTESFIVFSGRIFQYPRGDASGRAEAQAYGREMGIPEIQLNWTV